MIDRVRDGRSGTDVTKLANAFHTGRIDEAVFLRDKDDLELGRHHDELLVRVGPYRRAVVLPDSLRRRTVAGAALAGDRLEITFEREDDDEGVGA